MHKTYCAAFLIFQRLPLKAPLKMAAFVSGVLLKTQAAITQNCCKVKWPKPKSPSLLHCRPILIVRLLLIQFGRSVQTTSQSFNNFKASARIALDRFGRQEYNAFRLRMPVCNDERDQVETFTNLPSEKKNLIINAGLTAFGKSGYRKCSVSDIASLAGIAKSMIFHYFGTKRNMYFYLIEYIRDTIVSEVESMSFDAESDFFERIRLGTVVKVAVLKRYPYAVTFIKGFCFETDPEVHDEIRLWLAQGYNFSSGFALQNIDLKKFKPGIDPSLVVKMLHTYSEGLMVKAQYQSDLNIDEITAEFYPCLNMLRQNLYKEEFL